MARSLNKVYLLGNLGSDPELRTLPSGAKVVNVNLATTERYKSKDNWEEKTLWHRLVFWQGDAETVAQYCRKGSRIHIEGRIDYRKWTDDHGKDQMATDVVVRSLIMCDGRSGGGEPAQGGPPPDTGVGDDDLPF